MNKVIFLSLFFIMLSCSAAYKLAKQASDYEVSGNYKSAAYYYQKSLENDRDRVKSRIGLEKNGIKVLNEYIEEFTTYIKNNNQRFAYDKYDVLVDYANELSRFGIQYNIPSRVRSDYSDCKNKLAENEYNSGIGMLKSGQFEHAISYFEKAQKYISNYKNTSELITEATRSINLSNAETKYKLAVNYFEDRNYEKAIRYLRNVQDYIYNYKNTNELLIKAQREYNLAKAEEYYNQGKSYFSLNSFKNAYYVFEKCLNYQNPYKDAIKLKSEAFINAQKTIGIFPFINSSMQASNAHSAIYSKVLTKVVNHNDPFIKVFDRTNLQRLMNEHKLNSGGYIDPNYAIQNGKMLGLKYIITGAVVNINNNTQQPMRNILNVFGVDWFFDAYGIRLLYGVPIRIGHFIGHAEISLDFQIQIIDVQTGQIIESQIFSDHISDYVEYYETDVDPRGLSWNEPRSTIFYTFGIPSYRIDWIDAGMFQKRRTLKTTNDLENELVSYIYDDVANYIINYFKKL